MNQYQYDPSPELASDVKNWVQEFCSHLGIQSDFDVSASEYRQLQVDGSFKALKATITISNYGVSCVNYFKLDTPVVTIARSLFKGWLDKMIANAEKSVCSKRLCGDPPHV